MHVTDIALLQCVLQCEAACCSVCCSVVLVSFSVLWQRHACTRQKLNCCSVCCIVCCSVVLCVTVCVAVWCMFVAVCRGRGPFARDRDCTVAVCCTVCCSVCSSVCCRMSDVVQVHLEPFPPRRLRVLVLQRFTGGRLVTNLNQLLTRMMPYLYVKL